MRTPTCALLSLVLGAGCASTQTRIQTALNEPDPESYEEWMVEREYAVRGGDLSEVELLRMLDQGLKKWPDSWELHAVRASSLVRQGQSESAHEQHRKAMALYYEDPYCGEPLGTHTANQTMALTGSVLLLPAIIINEAVTDDVVIEYPTAPTEETWIPSFWRDSYLCSDEYDRAEIRRLAEDAQALGAASGEIAETSIDPKSPSEVAVRQTGSAVRELRDLAELHRSGALTDEEFKKAKAKLLE